MRLRRKRPNRVAGDRPSGSGSLPPPGKIAQTAARFHHPAGPDLQRPPCRGRVRRSTLRRHAHVERPERRRPRLVRLERGGAHPADRAGGLPDRPRHPLTRAPGDAACRDRHAAHGGPGLQRTAARLQPRAPAQPRPGRAGDPPADAGPAGAVVRRPHPVPAQRHLRLLRARHAGDQPAHRRPAVRFHDLRLRRELSDHGARPLLPGRPDPGRVAVPGDPPLPPVHACRRPPVQALYQPSRAGGGAVPGGLRAVPQPPCVPRHAAQYRHACAAHGRDRLPAGVGGTDRGGAHGHGGGTGHAPSVGAALLQRLERPRVRLRGEQQAGRHGRPRAGDGPQPLVTRPRPHGAPSRSPCPCRSRPRAARPA